MTSLAQVVLGWLALNPTKRPQYLVLMLEVPSRVAGCATNAINFPFYCADEPGIHNIYPSVSYELATAISAWQPFVTYLNMNGTNDCLAYISKLASTGTNYFPGKLLISANGGGYGNTNYYFDDNRDPIHYKTGPSLGGQAKASVLSINPSASVTYVMDDTFPHITSATNVVGYLCWGAHSTLGPNYPTDGVPTFYGNSGWYLVQTVESFNGQRYVAGYGNYIGWYSPNAFGATNYVDTPIGGVCNTDGRFLSGNNDSAIYFGLWEAEKDFVTCAWASRRTPYFLAVGDPFVKK